MLHLCEGPEGGTGPLGRVWKCTLLMFLLQGGLLHLCEGPEGGTGPLGRVWKCMLLMFLLQGGVLHLCEGPEGGTGPLGRVWKCRLLMVLSQGGVLHLCEGPEGGTGPLGRVWKCMSPMVLTANLWVRALITLLNWVVGFKSCWALGGKVSSMLKSWMLFKANVTFAMTIFEKTRNRTNELKLMTILDSLIRKWEAQC